MEAWPGDSNGSLGARANASLYPCVRVRVRAELRILPVDTGQNVSPGPTLGGVSGRREAGGGRRAESLASGHGIMVSHNGNTSVCVIRVPVVS